MGKPSVLDQSWFDFLAAAVPASYIGLYWYCAPKLLLSTKVEVVDTPEVEVGREVHADEAEMILEEFGPLPEVEIEVETLGDVVERSRIVLADALEKRKVIANPKDNEPFLFLSVIPSCGVVGRPDAADCSDGEVPIIVETKTSGTTYLDRPWANHRMQLAAYVVGLEALGFKAEYGIIEYISREEGGRERFQVDVTDRLRQQVCDTAESIRRIFSGDEDPIPPSNPNKCRSCQKEYRRHCKYDLAKTNE